jgi:hypothetical protein
MTTYSTDLTHFLTVKGAFPPDLPTEARLLAEFLGDIVAAVSGGAYTNFPETSVKCIEKARGKICGGIINAGFAGDIESAEISWHCPKCQTSGVIQGWEGTAWDMVENFLSEGTVH